MDGLGNDFYDAYHKENINDMKVLLERGVPVDIIVDNNENTLLIISSINKSLEVVIFLLENGANIEAKDVEGDTSLGCASFIGYSDVVSTLLKHGANIESTSISGDSPLIRAAIHCNTDVIKILIEYGADTEVKNNGGKTFMDYLDIEDKKEIENFCNRSIIKPAKR